MLMTIIEFVAGVEQFGERMRRLGLADARGPAEHEHADRLVRIVELGAAGLDALGDRVHRMILADDPLLQARRRSSAPPAISSLTIRPTGMPVQSPTTAATASGSTYAEHHRLVALSGIAARPALPRVVAVRASSVLAGFAAASTARIAAPSITASTRRLLALPLGADGLERRARLLQQLVELRRPARVAACRLLASRSTISRSTSSSSTRRARSSTGAGRRVLRHGDARAGGIEQADRLVGQLPRRDVALRQLHRRLHRLVEHDRPCGASPSSARPSAAWRSPCPSPARRR